MCCTSPAPSATGAASIHVTRLIERYGREAKLVDWKDQIPADCPPASQRAHRGDGSVRRTLSRFAPPTDLEQQTGGFAGLPGWAGEKMVG